MTSFMSSFFPGGKDRSAGDINLPRPATPTTMSENFINPSSTPQGSPSKKTNPPGANALPAAFDHAMTITPGIEPPLGLGRPQSIVTPLLPSKSSNAQPLDESSANVDNSVIHKSRSGSPLKK
ncbi:hypothetical protein B0J15DRAFT_571549 [Fusarium solani]|uniref:Uncharacterized protein n=1 Tax=Fusarium solani TaxID=169388 RepID=A0A9P9G8A0_FUSSL|nr:uncharacterized protein B0J15DRAFT_554899 [Fusarium solani]XP_046125047.1 uncharacterized protein B0J15DRAFT_571549 [Fusarium solani]KAH7234372.1 hypothetical protein B0J15DRAFT_554899 [Fusarium solani]KAH7234376.1 hypothetical protein B0J15DRAFT_571549 [Fusarium solani]